MTGFQLGILNPNLYWFNFYAIPNIVVSTCIFVVGFFVFLQNPKNSSNVFFFLFCLSLTFWLYGRALMYCSLKAETALAWAKGFAKLGVVNIAPLVYAFSVHWLGLYRQQKKFVIAGFILSIGFYFAILLTPYGLTGVRRYFWGYYPVYGPICKVFLAFFFIYFLSAFRNFFTEWKRASDPARHKQIQLVTIAYLISFTGSIDFLPKVINFPLYPFGYLCVFIWTMVMAYTIVRYRVMDIQTVIHKTLMWFASVTVAVLPFAVSIYLVHGWLSTLSGTGLAAAFMSGAIVFYLYFQAVKPRLDKIFQRRSVYLNLTLTRFSSELAHLKNLRDILQGFVRTLRRNLYTRDISILLRDDSEQYLVPVISKKMRGLKPIPLSHPFLKWIETKDQVLLGDYVQSYPAVQPFQKELAEYLESHPVKVIVPFISGGKMIGVAHLGSKDGMRRYTSEDISFLSRLKSPVTIAFSNAIHLAAMQENLQKWNEELEKKVKERTEQLQNTQAQLVQAEKLATIGTLAGGVAHEINNPLTAVLTNAQILKMTAQGEDLESISLIEEGAKRCQIIIQKLMKYARKPMGQETLGRVDINKVVDNTVAFLKYQMEQENVRMEVRKDPNLSAIQGNPNELEQVLINLILNAKDAVKQSGRVGIVKIETFEKDGAACFRVEDNGVGIPKENLSKIFDPFFTTKDVGKGTGLGLAVSFGIIQKHEGMIEATSQPGVGTAFMVRLPQFNSRKAEIL